MQVYFVDGDNIVHPGFWQLVASGKLQLGRLYTFDQFLAPPATVFLGDRVETWFIDTAMFVVDLELVGDVRFDAKEYTADGIFISEVYRRNSGRHVYIGVVAAFYNFSKQRYVSLLPKLWDKAWLGRHG